MTARGKQCLITFNDEIREDDFEAVKNALYLIKGVVDVHHITETNYDDMRAARRMKAEVRDKIWEFMKTVSDELDE